MLVLLKITNTVQGVLVGNHFIPLACSNVYDASLMKITTFKLAEIVFYFSSLLPSV